ncbi:gamma-glutamylcyclotransferase family protein [Caldinitratiruptor microaerophilus]|uniref:Gamma-glutamylcyclotransferase n=1 Tax=Caldinitratiruptor microaerophilus TaxID=671077 RepID=A0AA35G6Y0_9FIRM|nr:gamma-glutamylcyclotransferase family protein [Caldinitratiruptor microaerophilus]BDG59195.1 gamma-glutamylcyclotransferase [Caldinitratiruptor microaerophilus]
MPEARLYFAYGSNLDRAQMVRRCPTARPREPAVLRDYRLTFRARSGRHGVADIEPWSGGAVPGGLWDVFPADLKALDIYEGVPYLYRRETVTVETAMGATEALVYVMQPGHGYAAPHPRYLEVIQRGYRDWGLDPTPLREAVRRVGGPAVG